MRKRHFPISFFTAETVLITGGYGALHSAELLMPWSGATCRSLSQIEICDQIPNIFSFEETVKY